MEKNTYFEISRSIVAEYQFDSLISFLDFEALLLTSSLSADTAQEFIDGLGDCEHNHIIENIRERILTTQTTSLQDLTQLT